MFKNRPFKIRVSGCSGIAIIILLVLIISFLLITVPLFGFFGLSIILENYQLAELDFLNHWYQNALYFGWFLLLVFGIVFLIDLIGLFILASFDIDYSAGISLISTFIQFGICLLIYKQILMSIFSRIDATWLGAGITVTIIYLIISVFTSTTVIEESD